MKYLTGTSTELPKNDCNLERDTSYLLIKLRAKQCQKLLGGELPTNRGLVHPGDFNGIFVGASRSRIENSGELTHKNDERG